MTYTVYLIASHPGERSTTTPGCYMMDAIDGYILSRSMARENPDFGCRVVDKAEAEDLRPDWTAYISADQTAQWLKVNRPDMVASKLEGDRRIGMLSTSNE